MRAVWKFPLAFMSATQIVQMPSRADIKHVHHQVIAGLDYVVLWAEVERSAPLVERKFRIYATGQTIDLPVYRYMGTAHAGATVWHVYEDVS